MSAQIKVARTLCIVIYPTLIVNTCQCRFKPGQHSLHIYVKQPELLYWKESRLFIITRLCIQDWSAISLLIEYLFESLDVSSPADPKESFYSQTQDLNSPHISIIYSCSRYLGEITVDQTFWQQDSSVRAFSFFLYIVLRPKPLLEN